MHSTSHHRSLQFFVRSPISETRTLTLNPAEPLPLHRLKASLIPSSAARSRFYFILNGKPLSDSITLPSPQIAPLSTLVLLPRLSGGGGDGGATGAESRDCYLNMYAVKKPDKVDPHEQRLSKWVNCTLTNEPLREPCVIDKLGNMFNKEPLVEGLIGKKLPKGLGHIKGLKDMVNIKLSLIPGKESDVDGSRFQCPITGLEFNGKYRFFALRTCGHVLSAKALKEVKSSSCLVCHQEFLESDKIVINGTDDEVAALREKMEEEKAKVKDKKATKKVKNSSEAVVNGHSNHMALDSSHGVKKRGMEVSQVDKASARVEGNGKVERVNVASNGAAKKFKATDNAPRNATKEVYASIFTSSKKTNFRETYSCRSLPLGRN